MLLLLALIGCTPEASEVETPPVQAMHLAQGVSMARIETHLPSQPPPPRPIADPGALPTGQAIYQDCHQRPAPRKPRPRPPAWA